MSTAEPTSAALPADRPSLAAPLRLTEPTLPDQVALARQMDAMWRERWLSNHGPLERRFARSLASWLDVPDAVPTASCTAGLTATLMALGVRGEVIVPAFTFSATVHAVLAAGARPVFADVCPRSWCLGASEAVAALSPRTEAILAVHVFGRPCDAPALASLAEARGLALVFDAAHAFGSRYEDGRRVGGAGDAEVFSFHATKLLAVGEGGAICTRDATVAERCRQVIDFGRRDGELAVRAGMNGKMQEWNAALGVLALGDVELWVARRRRLYRLLRSELDGIDGLSWQRWRPGQRANRQHAAVRVDPEAFGMDAAALQRALAAQGIETRRYLHPALHRHPAFQHLPKAPLPETERLSGQVLCLPLFSHMRVEQMQAVAKAIRGARPWEGAVPSVTGTGTPCS